MMRAATRAERQAAEVEEAAVTTVVLRAIDHRGNQNAAQLTQLVDSLRQEFRQRNSELRELAASHHARLQNLIAKVQVDQKAT